MTTFTIDSADHIEHTTGNRKPDAGDHFSSLDELGHLAGCGKTGETSYALMF